MVLLQHYHLMIQVDPSQAQVATQTAQAQSPHQAVLVAQVVAAVTHLVVAALLLRLAVVALVAVVVEVVEAVTMVVVTRYFYLSRPYRQKNTPNFFSGSW